MLDLLPGGAIAVIVTTLILVLVGVAVVDGRNKGGKP